MLLIHSFLCYSQKIIKYHSVEDKKDAAILKLFPTNRQQIIQIVHQLFYVLFTDRFTIRKHLYSFLHRFDFLF